jgi:hypothetical protein
MLFAGGRTRRLRRSRLPCARPPRGTARAPRPSPRRNHRAHAATIRAAIRAAIRAFAGRASAAQAALISQEWRSGGESLITVEDGGRRWLALSGTLDRSLGPIVAQPGVGGMFGGFQVAALADTEGIRTSAG